MITFQIPCSIKSAAFNSDTQYTMSRKLEEVGRKTISTKVGMGRAHIILM